MNHATGDYLIIALAYDGKPIDGAALVKQSLTDAQIAAPELARLHHAPHWQILKIMAQSTDPDRWQAK